MLRRLAAVVIVRDDRVEYGDAGQRGHEVARRACNVVRQKKNHSPERPRNFRRRRDDVARGQHDIVLVVITGCETPTNLFDLYQFAAALGALCERGQLLGRCGAQLTRRRRDCLDRCVVLAES